jgi:Alpha/beta hydrolase domain
MKIEITSIEPAFDGVEFGDVGRYEKVVGRIRGGADPDHHLNAGIVNLDRAPRGAAGMVEYCVDFCLLKPADPRGFNGRILYDVINRGNKLALTAFNDAPASPNLSAAADAGNGFLMRQGYAVLWSAWQGDVAPGEGRMVASLPVATNNGAPIVGVNRDEFIFNHPHTPARAPLSYPAHMTDQTQAALTVRQRERDPRLALPATAWRYLSNRAIEITRPAGFDGGAIYEFIYPARDPIVMGLGFAAVRDVVSFLRHRAADDDGSPNPLSAGGGAPAVAQVYAFGMSQSGRFLRDWLWQGFNEDLNGARVFDGVIPSLAGARKTFTNFAFAQPGRFSCQHEDHLTPGDQFPFTYATRSDPLSGRTDGILARYRASGCRPRIMQTDSSGEFWQGRASLVVTDETGRDLELPEDVRMYTFCGTQHGGRFATAVFPFCRHPGNPVEMSAPHRALLVALDRWVSAGVPPPPSSFPRVSDRTLVVAPALDFAAVPGAAYTGLLNELYEVDFTVQPPRPLADHKYAVLVPAVDVDGNELGGVRLPDIVAPMGTHTGWNPRREGFAPGELALLGSYFPFAKTAAERRAAGDKRASLEERYAGHEAYVEAVTRAARELCEARLVLPEDVERYIEMAKRRAKYFN